MASVPRFEGLRFLIGEWTGEGTVRDGRVTSRVTGTYRRDDGAILLDHVTEGPDLPRHREKVVFRERRERLTAVVKPHGAADQEFRAAPCDAGWRFVREDKDAGTITWDLVPEGEDAYVERFTVVEDGAPVTVVELRHRRAGT